MLPYLMAQALASYIEKKWEGSLFHKMASSMTKEKEIAAKCAAAGFASTPAGMADSILNVPNIATLSPSRSHHGEKLTGKVRAKLGVAEDDLNNISKEDAAALKTPEDIKKLGEKIATKHFACAGGVLTGTVTGALASTIAVSAATGGIMGARVSFAAASQTEAAYMAVAATLQTGNSILLGDSLVGIGSAAYRYSQKTLEPKAP